MRKLVLRLQARLDVHNAASWYENQRLGLGTRFVDELDYVANRIRISSFQFPEIHPAVRRGLLNRFPYSVYFSVSERSIEVIAVLHQHRHPETWRDRL
jgi:plasmid stabilization system protein ParE